MSSSSALRHFSRRRFAAVPLAALVASAVGLPQRVLAQSYPNQPVRMLVGFPPGGPTDVAARLAADALARAFGQPVLVENRPGANATIATEQVARAKPDGYTVLMAATNHTINAALYKGLKFDTDKSFAPIAAVAVAPTVLVVSTKFPAKNYAEFLAAVKSQPGKFSYASAGNGGTPHLAAEMFKMLTRTAIVHIPYKGAAPAMTDLVAGQVDLSFATLGSVLPQIQAGQVRAIAVAAPTRSRLLPNVPTFEESGLKNFRLDSWYGVLAPAGTPRDSIELIHGELAKLVVSPAYRDKLEAAGLEPVVGSTPAKFAEQIRAEIAAFAKLAQANNLSID